MSRSRDSRASGEMSGWTRSQILILIKLYEANENLYNYNHLQYHNRFKRETTLAAMVRELRRSRPGTTLDQVKSKLKCLRGQYMTEKRKIEESRRSGVPEGEVYEPTLWCFELLTFLNRYAVTREPCLQYSAFKSPAAGSSDLQHQPQALPLPGGSSSPATPAVGPGGTKRKSDGETTNPPAERDRSTPLQDTLLQFEDDELSTRSFDDLISDFVPNDHYAEEDPLQCPSEWEVPSEFAKDPKPDSPSSLGMAYEEIARFKRLFSGGLHDPKQHDQFGLDIAEELRGFNNAYYVSMAKLKIRQVLFDMQKMSHRLSFKEKKQRPSQPPPTKTTSTHQSFEHLNVSEKPNASRKSNEAQSMTVPPRNSDIESSILPLEPEEATLDSIVIKTEEALEAEEMEMVDQVAQAVTGPDGKEGTPPPSRTAENLSKRFKSHYRRRGSTPHKSPPQKAFALPTQLSGLSTPVAPSVISSSPMVPSSLVTSPLVPSSLVTSPLVPSPLAPASATATVPLGALQMPQQRVLLMLPGTHFASTGATTTVTMTLSSTPTTDTSPTSTTASTSHPKPAITTACLQSQAGTSPAEFVNPLQKPPDLQTDLFESVLVKEESAMDMEFSETTILD